MDFLYRRKSIIRASINRASKKNVKLLNCTETLLEFLEQKDYSNVSDILTLRKLRTSIKLKRSKKTEQRFLAEFSRKIPDSRPYEKR
jgi:hypothetical protein